MIDQILKWVLFLGLAGLIVGRTFVSGLVYSDINVLFLIWVIFLYFVWFLRSVLIGEWVLYKIPLNILHGVFLLGLFLSWFFSVNPYEGISFVLSILTAIMTFYLVMHVIHSGSQMCGLISIFLVTGSLVSFYGIYQSLFGLEETRQWVQLNLQVESLSPSFQQRLTSPRVFSTFIYPNVLAGYLLMLMPLSLATLSVSKKFYARIVLYSCLGGALMFIFFEKAHWILAVIALSIFYPVLYFLTFLLTLSKGGLVVFYFLQWVGSAVAYVWIPQRMRRIYVGIILALQFGIILFLFLNLDSIATQLWPSLKVRLEYWQSAVTMIFDFPLWGTGPNTFGSVYGRYKLLIAEETRMAHHNFLQMTSEHGLLTGFVFLLIVMVPLVKGFRELFWIKKSNSQAVIYDRGGIGAFFGILAFFLHSLTDFDFYEPAIALYLWIFLALFYRSRAETKVWKVFKIERSAKKIIFILSGQLIAILVILALRIPYQAECVFKEALRAYTERDFQRADSLLNQSLKLNSLNPHAHFLKGSLLEVLGKPESALREFDKAQRWDPFNPAFPYRKALLLNKLSHVDGKDYFPQIEECLKKAVENYPTHPFYKRKLSEFYESIRLKKDAVIE